MSYRIAIDARKIHDFGIGTYIYNIVHGLAEIDSENQYFLLVGPQGESAFGPLPDNFTVQVENSPLYSVREFFQMSWCLRRLKIDLYHASHYVLPLWVPGKTVVTIHDIIHLLYPDFLPSPLALFYANNMIRYALRRGDRIITVSQNTANDLARFFTMNLEKVDVIYNGVQETFHQRVPQEKAKPWREKFNIQSPYVLFVGNPKPHKNLDRVVKAFAQVVKRGNPDTSLVCVGGREPEYFKIRQRAEQLGIGDRILLVGLVPDEALPSIYQGATLFLYPTLYEGFGLPVIEAMASGVPVITSNTSALKEIAEGYAHLVDPLDVDALADAISHYLEDSEHRISLSTLGLQRSETFCWRQAAQETLDSYYRALES